MNEQQDPTPTPALVVRCTSCRRCSSTTWPEQPFGCERCGAHGDDLAVLEVPARGTLQAFATVHTHPTVPVPFTVIEVLLDAGMVVRAVCDTEHVPTIGTPVRAVGRGAADRLLFAAAAGRDAPVSR